MRRSARWSRARSRCARSACRAGRTPARARVPPSDSLTWSLGISLLVAPQGSAQGVEAAGAGALGVTLGGAGLAVGAVEVLRVRQHEAGGACELGRERQPVLLEVLDVVDQCVHRVQLC